MIINIPESCRVELRVPAVKMESLGAWDETLREAYNPSASDVV